MSNPYRLYAHIGSPYSMKMRGVLRYRRIPHVTVSSAKDWSKAFGKVRVPVMPVLEYPDGSFKNDSTPLILDLEEKHAERSVVPVRESDAFLAALIEDMADEWGSKAMYAYRWAFPEHTNWTGRLIAFDQHFGQGAGVEKIEKAGHAFETRQVGRNALVGCTEANMPMLIHIAEAILDALESSVPDQLFLFGTRPSNADFAIFGQISQFTLDLAAIDVCQQRAPYAMRWTHHMHDLSGHDGEWRAEGKPLAAAIEPLLALTGEAYLPFLVANAAALENGDATVSIEAHGLSYEAAPFKYQARCLAQLRKSYGALSSQARSEADPLLEKHGCLQYLKPQG
ncbi:MAG: glutathione S-transferase [Myxococcota bacterium]|jgi:glutathione S-transferase